MDGGWTGAAVGGHTQNGTWQRLAGFKPLQQQQQWGTLQIIGVTLCAAYARLSGWPSAGREPGPGNREAAADGPGNGNGQAERGKGEGTLRIYALGRNVPHPILATQSIVSRPQRLSKFQKGRLFQNEITRQGMCHWRIDDHGNLDWPSPVGFVLHRS